MDRVRALPVLVWIIAGFAVGSLVAQGNAPPAAVQNGKSEKSLDTESLTRDAAESLVAELWAAHKTSLAEALADEDQAAAYTTGEQTLKVLEKEFGTAPAGGHSLWISMHGGGGAPKRVNDQQWQNQIRLYEPEEGFYVAPRAPTDEWNLWHQGPVDELFDRLIASYVVRRGVDPDRVYLMGYSAGGDGVYQLAPRMADRFAAASMMAGHPNEAQAWGLRNLPFAIFMGGNDGAYDRNKVARTWGDRLDELQKEDPEGYVHQTKIYPGKGHWMDREDAEALPWMAEKKRVAWPKRVVWYQDDVTHQRFYWLGVAAEEARMGNRVEAAVDGQTVTVDSAEVRSVMLRLRDGLIDLDLPVTVVANGTEVWSGVVPRTRQAIVDSLQQRADPVTAATAVLTVKIPPVAATPESGKKPGE